MVVQVKVILMKDAAYALLQTHSYTSTIAFASLVVQV